MDLEVWRRLVDPTKSPPSKMSLMIKVVCAEANPRFDSKPLGKAWDRVRSHIVLPILQRKCFHLHNGDYNQYVTLWLDTLRRLKDTHMRGPEGASIREMLQVNHANELARNRAFEAALDQVNASSDVHRVMQLLIELKQETYRAVGAHYELSCRFFNKSMGRGQAPREPSITRSSATEELGEWFQSIQGGDSTVLKGLPSYPDLPEQTTSKLAGEPL